MELNFLISIVDRDKTELISAIYAGFDLPLNLTLMAHGTAKSEHLSLYGLEATDKAAVASVVSAEKTRQLIKAAKRRLFIDIPGNGIMLAIPLKSVGGGRTLAYLTDNAVPDSAVPAMSFEHELIIVILNEGHIDAVMEAARAAGAGGGTSLHAKGTGAKRAEKFFGVSLADEKEVILIVSQSAKKADIMRSIAKNAGTGTPSGAICFSLPISAVAGLRAPEED